jgi:superfamily II DNA or RNA helicase
MYGLSATLKRLDRAEAELESLFGEVIYRMSYAEAQRLCLVPPVKVEWIRVQLDFDPAAGKIGVPRDRWGLWRNERRNQLIAEKALEFADDVQVLIMVATVEHAVNLKKFLPEFALCYDKMDRNDYRRYVSAGILDENSDPLMTPARRDEIRDGFERKTIHKVIATDVWSTGVDFSDLQVLIRADGRSTEILDTQIPGRVTRIADGKEFGLLIDCWDEFSQSLLRKSMSRRKNYLKNGWTMEPIGSRNLRSSPRE